jgi:hypothetical protein
MRVLAYLDAGSGSIILQALLGGFAAVIVSIKLFGKKVYRTLFFWKDHDDDDEAAQPTAVATQPPAEAEKDTVKETV